MHAQGSVGLGSSQFFSIFEVFGQVQVHLILILIVILILILIFCYGHVTTRVVFCYKTFFLPIFFFCFQAFETKKGPANLVQGQDGHVRF